MSGPGAVLRALLRPIAWPRPGREHVLALFGLAALVAFLFRGAIFGGGVLFRRDINMVWLPQVETFVHCVAAGSWPLWDPFSGFGRPLLADPRAEILYPPTWLNLLMSPGTYYTLFTAIHLVGSGLGLYGLARRFGVSRLGSLLAGAVWITSGPLLSLVSMWHHLAGAAWIPWLFLAGDLALDTGRWRHVLLWGACLAAQILAGSPDFTALALPCVALYVVVRRPSWRASASPPRRGPLAIAALAGAFGLALSAAQWLPTLEWALATARPVLRYEDRTTWSLHPLALLELLTPQTWASLPLQPSLATTLLGFKEPWLHSIFFGVPALALVLAGAISRQPRSLFLAAVAVGSLLVALGRYGWAYDAAVFLMPPLKMLRYPVKAMVLSAFAWSLLAGFGTDLWRRTQERPRRVWLLSVVAPLGLVLGLALAATAAAAHRAEAWGASFLSAPTALRGGLLAPVAAGFASTAAVTGVVLVLALAGLRRRPPGGWPAAALAALAVGQLVVAHRDLHVVGHRDLFRLRPPVLAYLEGEGFPRLYVYDYSILTEPQPRSNPQALEAYRVARVPLGWTFPEALVLGVHFYLNPPTAARWRLPGSFDHDILGFEPVPLARLVEFLRKVEDTPGHERLLRIGGVRYVLALVPGAWWRDLVPTATVEGILERPIQVLRVRDPLPRTYVVDGVRLADGEEAQAMLVDPEFDPTREVVLPAGAPRTAGPSPPGTSRILALRPDHVTLEADLVRPGLAVLLDAYDPGWRATVDGSPAEVLRANVAFRAVEVPPGRHRIEYVYRPRGVRAGGALSVAALFAGLLSAAMGARRPPEAP
ncbi:MAG: YfhO family protein [Acidobacteria bacterium]|nr:YfhO family protein [Acidobacteriota bacterium]